MQVQRAVRDAYKNIRVTIERSETSYIFNVMLNRCIQICVRRIVVLIKIKSPLACDKLSFIQLLPSATFFYVEQLTLING